jgi:anti-sigma factor RsiW
MRLLRQDLHLLAGVYALDALEPGGERDRFSHHLNRCPSCASEVRGFREVATTLAFAAAAEPPPGLRERVMAAVARTRQLPPEVTTRARPRR